LIPSIYRLPAALVDLLNATLAKPKHFANLASPDIPLDVGAMRVLPKEPTALAFVVGKDGEPQNVAQVQSFAFS
jgi:hypothetical protein